MQYTTHDERLCSDPTLSVHIQIPEGGSSWVSFQFPPRVFSDNRKGTWAEQEARADEKMAEFKTSGGREITLSFYYIVDGGRWNVERIKNQITLVRGYFSNVRRIGLGRDGMIVGLQLWGIGGLQQVSARVKSVNVKHGETLVGQSSVQRGRTARGSRPQLGDVVFPLRTDITMDMELWTQKDNLQKIDGLENRSPPDWY